MPTPYRHPHWLSRQRSPVALAALWALWAYSHGLWAQTAPAATPDATAAEDALLLKLDAQLLARTQKTAPAAAPMYFLEGDQLAGSVGDNVVLSGAAQLRSSKVLIHADALEYQQKQNLVLAQGRVRIDKDGNVFTGKELRIDPDTFAGYMTAPHYQFVRSQGGGQAERIDFKNKDQSTVYNANYTSCSCVRQQPNSDGSGTGTASPGNCSTGEPAWELKATQVDFDNQTETADAQNVQLRFLGVPILAAPSLSFPLTDARTSGLLPPTIALDNINGFEYLQPFYWNIAPQMDATFSPSLKTKRGINFGNEFRYLGAQDSGQVNFSFMPDDRLRDTTRWGLDGQYQYHWLTPSYDWAPNSSLTFYTQIHRVSDGNYWSDFAEDGSLTQRALPTEARLDWQSDHLYAQVQALKWQTQQVPSSIITPPYDRLPSLTVGWRNEGIAGFNYHAEVNQTRFEADPALTGQPNAWRTVGKVDASYALRQPGWFIVPKVQMQWRDYRFDTPLANGDTQRSLSTPTFSLDSGLIFERNTSYFGHSFVQTLEPRAFYTYTPYRAQNDLPNYDSQQNEFDFTSIYTENAYTGEDRLANNNLLTLGVQSRLIDPVDGSELLRLGYAQRLRYRDQLIVLPGGQPDTARFSDMLFGVQANLNPRWGADAFVQYNPKTERSERSVWGVRYHPSDYHTFSLSYLYQQNQSEIVDMGWQWPLTMGSAPFNPATSGQRGQGLGPGRWYGVGRINYSLPESKPINALVGLEYDGGCWIGRVALERWANGANPPSKRILFQLEFVGFSRLGTSPEQTLQEFVPHYQTLRSRYNTPGATGTGSTPGTTTLPPLDFE